MTFDGFYCKCKSIVPYIILNTRSPQATTPYSSYSTTPCLIKQFPSGHQPNPKQNSLIYKLRLWHCSRKKMTYMYHLFSHLFAYNVSSYVFLIFRFALLVVVSVVSISFIHRPMTTIVWTQNDKETQVILIFEFILPSPLMISPYG